MGVSFLFKEIAKIVFFLQSIFPLCSLKPKLKYRLQIATLLLIHAILLCNDNLKPYSTVFQLFSADFGAFALVLFFLIMWSLKSIAQWLALPLFSLTSEMLTFWRVIIIFHLVLVYSDEHKAVFIPLNTEREEAHLSHLQQVHRKEVNAGRARYEWLL